MIILKPILKWTGSKRSQIPAIQKHLPATINNYYEPFVGGANVVGNLVVECKNKRVNDCMYPLMDFYCLFQDNPTVILEHYRENWTILQHNPKHFYLVRERFNLQRDPLDFFFLCRTSHNGLVRFNRKGFYNSSIAHTPDGRGYGINPANLLPIFCDWAHRLARVEFWSEDYRTFLSNRLFEADDFVYCDPPYVSDNPAYGYTNFLITDFVEELMRLTDLGVKWMCSYYGQGAKEIDDIAVRKVLLESGPSSFRKLNGQTATLIFESLYMNYV